MKSLAETRRACEVAQIEKLRARGIPDPEELVAEVAGGLRLCKTEAFCRKLTRSVDSVFGKVMTASMNGAAASPSSEPPREHPPAERGEPGLRDRVMALLAEVGDVRGRRSA